MAVRQALPDLERLTSRNHRFPGQHPLERRHLLRRPMRQVGQGSCLDLPILAVRFPQQDGRR
jgi:hypothetical protein